MLTSKPKLPKTPSLSKRYLILTADDFGASKNINEGIKFAVENKAITSISVLSNFTASLPDLKEISEKHQYIGIGVHLNIVTGKPILGVEHIPSLVGSNGNFYTLEEVLPRIDSISLDELRKELRAQVLVFKKYGIKIDNLSDQNGVLSVYRPFFDIVTELAEEFNLPIRSPIIAGIKFPELFSNSNMAKRGRQLALKLATTAPLKALRLKKYFRIEEMERKAQKLDELGILHPDLFVEGFWGDPTASNLLRIIEHLPKGVSEIVFHFGSYVRQENYPSGLDLNYFKNREYELITATSDYLKKYINYLSISTINFSQLLVLKKK